MIRIVRRPELCELTGMSYSSIVRRIHKGTFPAPLMLGTSGQAIGWYLHEVEAWLKNLKRVPVDSLEPELADDTVSASE